MHNSNLDYYDHVNSDLLALIPSAANLIVEYGCGTGKLGEAFKSRSPKCRYVGIELNREVAEMARARLDVVHHGDEWTEFATLGLAPQSVDCLVYGDVLEHMADPWSALKRHSAWLRVSGMVAACIPNIEHWSILLRLIEGRWGYEDHGLLDRTHLRFFTIDTIKQMFAGAGLRIVSIRSRRIGTRGFAEFKTHLEPLFREYRVDERAFSERAQALQYLILAIREAAR